MITLQNDRDIQPVDLYVMVTAAVSFEVVAGAQVCVPPGACCMYALGQQRSRHRRLFKWSSMLGDGHQVPVATNKLGGRTSKSSEVPSVSTKYGAANQLGRYGHVVVVFLDINCRVDDTRVA